MHHNLQIKTLSKNQAVPSLRNRAKVLQSFEGDKWCLRELLNLTYDCVKESRYFIEVAYK
ncbi:hypothetical protein F511_14198 [Dorcoceras hygrometricum]|uniref:Uncharacterized protein n=1 Tax=Dorcoceras hygrometricum TaxID=472368 RepID=A0A2Z7D258_9LAMI|nr:hypothetical protein F511_14198 [Dorcoceras hygrometricum]